MNQSEQLRAVQLMQDSSSNSSGGDGSKVSPCQRHSGDGVMTVNELQDLIDQVIGSGNDTIVLRILVGSCGQEG